MVCLTGSSEPVPTWKEPDVMSGRQTPASCSAPHSPKLGVQGKPLLQLVVLLSCHPPTTESMARLEPPIYFLPFPNGNSYTVLNTNTWLRLKSTGPYATGWLIA